MKHKVKLFVMTQLAMLFVRIPVYAKTADVGEPVIVSGTKLLIAALIGIATGLVTSFITLSALKTGSLWINASPEEKPKHQKELITTIIAGVITLTIGSTITYIIGFYKG